MDTTTAPDRATFTNPVLRARLNMVRLLQIVDELEAATARGDDFTMVHLARQARERLEAAQAAVDEAVLGLGANGALGIVLADWTDPAETATAILDGLADSDAGMLQYQADGR